MTMDITMSPVGGHSKVVFTTGYSATYLGNVPTETSSGREYIDYCIEKVLDRCNVTESNMAAVYVTIRPRALVVYYVDGDCRVTHTTHFDLARIAQCSAASGDHRTTLAWLYREPLNGTIQVVCHVARFKNEKTARVVGAQLYEAFQSMYADCEMALVSSRLLAKIVCQPDAEGGYENTAASI